jgi:hypothetical protein
MKNPSMELVLALSLAPVKLPHLGTRGKFRIRKCARTRGDQRIKTTHIFKFNHLNECCEPPADDRGICEQDNSEPVNENPANHDDPPFYQIKKVRRSSTVEFSNRTFK